uniref:MARVEL domain-containing protein n=1 Tax=Anopheles farauti TaxID=69004 RepID=A0A182Q371_9DIPT
MEPYIRFYLKFQGYMIGAMTVMFSILMTFVIFESNDPIYPMEMYYNYRFMGSTALVLGLFWFVAGATFLYGVHQEIKQCLLPFALLYLFDLCLLAIRDLVMVWHDRRWYTMVFVNLPSMIAVLYITCYLLMTLIALTRLFSSDPKPQTGDNFVRFNNGIANPLTVDEEAALVAE